MKFQMTDIIDKTDFEQRLKAFKESSDVGTPSPNDYNSKLYICGPEYEYEYAGFEDSSDSDAEPESVPEGMCTVILPYLVPFVTSQLTSLKLYAFIGLIEFSRLENNESVVDAKK
mgnify:CR=1 FL=1